MSQTLLIDSAVPLDPRDIKAAGYIGVIRYIAPPDAKYDWKRLTILERDGYWEHGLGVLPVFESYATRATEGMSAGMEDARTGQVELAKLGYPGDLPVIFTCDTDTTALTARPYFRGVTTIRFQSGAYGGVKVVDPLLADGTVRWGMQACAWSNDPHGNPLVSQTAHLYQRLRPTTPLAAQHPGEFDEDVMLHPIPLWLPAPPTPKGYKMLVFAQGLDATTALAVCAAKRLGVATTDITEAKAAIARGDKVIVIGGPAAAALGLKAPVSQPTNVGGATVAIGQTASDTLTLACQVIA